VVGVAGPVDEGCVDVGGAVKVCWETAAVERDGNAVIVICCEFVLGRLRLPDSENDGNVRFGFWPGSVSSGSVMPSAAQSTTMVSSEPCASVYDELVALAAPNTHVMQLK
jgi:hypothetical protein